MQKTLKTFKIWILNSQSFCSLLSKYVLVYKKRSLFFEAKSGDPLYASDQDNPPLPNTFKTPKGVFFNTKKGWDENHRSGSSGSELRAKDFCEKKKEVYSLKQNPETRYTRATKTIHPCPILLRLRKGSFLIQKRGGMRTTGSGSSGSFLL